MELYYKQIRVMVVRMRASVLSLGSGGGIPIFVDQNKVCQKWRNLLSEMHSQNNLTEQF